MIFLPNQCLNDFLRDQPTNSWTNGWTNGWTSRPILSGSMQLKQGWVLGYNSRIRVGRGSDEDSQWAISAGAVSLWLSKKYKKNSRKSVRWSAVPMPRLSRLCLKMKGKQDLCHRQNFFSSSSFAFCPQIPVSRTQIPALKPKSQSQSPNPSLLPESYPQGPKPSLEA